MDTYIRQKSTMLKLIAACVFSLLSGSVSPDIGDLKVFPKNNP